MNLNITFMFRQIKYHVNYAMALCLVGLLLPGSTLAVEKIIVNGLFQDKAVVSIDGKRRVLKKDEPSPEGVTLIEADSKQAILEIDGERQTYTLGTQIGSSYEKPENGKKLIIVPGPGDMYRISGSINGFATRFVVDTGASLVTMNSSVAKRVGIDYKLIGTESVVYTASGKNKMYIVKLDRVRVGDIELRDVQGAVLDGDYPVEALLGMSFLGRLEMKREGRIMELQKKY